MSDRCPVLINNRRCLLHEGHDGDHVPDTPALRKAINDTNSPPVFRKVVAKKD